MGFQASPSNPGRYLRGRSRARRAARHALHRDCPLRSEFSSVPVRGPRGGRWRDKGAWSRSRGRRCPGLSTSMRPLLMSLSVPLKCPSTTSDADPLPAACGPRRPPSPRPSCSGVTAAPSPPQTAPGHAPAPPGPGVVFLGLPGPGLAGACLPPQPGRLLAEPAAPPPAGRRLALAGAQPAAAAGGHRPGRRPLGAPAQLLRRAPAPHVSARGGAEALEGGAGRGGGRWALGEGADPQSPGPVRGWIGWA